MSAGDVNDPNNPGNAMGKGLGTEFDLYFGFALTEGVAFKGGYSQMFGSETIEVIKNNAQGSKNETSNWAYAMVIFKPQLFNNKK